MTHTSSQAPALRMSQGKRHRERGFTLIELMIVVAIIAILAAIAYPSYTRYVQEARRTDAISSLMDVAGQLERCYTVASDYTASGCPSGSQDSDEGFYTVSINASSASYTLTASPKSGTTQASDSGCPSFTLDQTGEKGPEATADDCW